MKRTLAFLLTCVLLLTSFATIPVFAEEREEKAFWHFSLRNFRCGAKVEDITIDMKEYRYDELGENYDYENLYDTWEAHIEYENGEIATGKIETLVQYYLAIRVDGISGEALKYTSLVTCGNQYQPYPAYVYEYYYQDESSVIVKYKLPMLIDPITEPLICNIEGYEIGADPEKVKITCESEYISVDGWLKNPTADLRQKPIQEGIKYSAYIELHVPYEYKIADDPSSIDFVIKGLDEDIVGELIARFGNGVTLFYTASVSLPVLGDPLPKIEEFDFSIEGYEKGNTASQIEGKSGKEDTVILDSFLSKHQSVIEKQDDEYVLEIGKGYTYVVDIEIPKGYDIDIDKLRLATVTVNGVDAAITAQRSKEVYERFRITVALPMLYIDGDVDYDGVHTVSDALVILRAAALMSEPAEQLITVGDFDGDGEITVSDALAVLRLAAKLN